MKIYISAISTISPQNTFNQESLSGEAVIYAGNRLQNIEPDYTKLLDVKSLRRMSRIIKIGAATASACLKEAGNNNPGAIITATAYGCVEDTTTFLTDAIKRQEEALTPTAFIQSTHNTVGAQIALQIKCHNYNNTFVHRGFSFESALLDALLLLQEEETDNVLAGSIDELTNTSFTILNRFGLYKPNLSSTTALYTTKSKGTVAGEGAAFFLLTNQHTPAVYGCLEAVATFYKPKNITETAEHISSFLMSNFITAKDISLVITGRNGDMQEDEIYEEVQRTVLVNSVTVNYKHLCGEYPTSTSFALWLAATIIKTGKIPEAMGNDLLKNQKIKRILIYNHYQNTHHSLLLLSAAE